MLSVFSCTYWSSAILLWKNIYSVLLPIFKYHLQIFPPIQLVFYSFFSMVSFAMQKLLILSQSVISVSQSCLTLCNPKDCSMPGFLVHYPLLEIAQTHVHRVGDAILPSPPLLSPSPPAFHLSQHQGVFHWSVLRIRWPKYWSFSFSISPSNEYSGLISFRIDWLDFLAVQGTLKSLLQHRLKNVNQFMSENVLSVFL